MLTQRNDREVKGPIDFQNSYFQGEELKHFDIENQAYDVFKTIKHFRHFLMKSHTKVVVPFSSVQNLLVQKDLVEKRAHWVTSLHEYDLEIKLAKILGDQGLCN